MFKRALLIVAAIGLGMLIAPKDGKTNRRTVSNKLQQVRKSVENKLRRK